MGEASGDGSGYSVSTAGDVNGDGVDDLVIGAPGTVGSAGSSYVVFGGAANLAWLDFSDNLRDGVIDLAALDGTYGFRLDGVATGNGTGNSVSSAGDINGDKIGDLVIGAPGADTT